MSVAPAVVPESLEEPVIIVGAGPVGLALAIELGTHRIPVIVLERREQRDQFPGLVNIANVRSSEIFRRWGIVDQIRALDPVEPTIARSLVFATRLNGHVVLELKDALAFADGPPFAPETPLWMPLVAFDNAMRAKVARLPSVEILWGHVVTGVAQGDGGVTVQARAGGRGLSLVGSQVVIADGGAGGWSGRLGFEPVLGAAGPETTAWHFRAPDLQRLFRTPLASCTFFVNNDLHSDALIAQGNATWLYTLTPCPEPVDGDDWEAVKQLLLQSVGTRFEATAIEGGRRGARFMRANRFRSGDVFLAGDAAHFMPLPGWGMNLGLGDAVDLGWKLTAWRQGWGGSELLDSYEIERGAVFDTTAEALLGAAVTPMAELMDADVEAEGVGGDAARARVAGRILGERLKEMQTVGLELGYGYDGSPLVVGDGTAREPLSVAEYTPSGRPGGLAPHAWLGDGTSLYDRFGPWFTLLRLGPAEPAPLVQAAARTGLPMDVLGLQDSGLREPYGADLVLVRPDQHIAWRGNDASGAEAIIDAVRGQGDRLTGPLAASALRTHGPGSNAVSSVEA